MTAIGLSAGVFGIILIFILMMCIVGRIRRQVIFFTIVAKKSKNENKITYNKKGTYLLSINLVSLFLLFSIRKHRIKRGKFQIGKVAH